MQREAIAYVDLSLVAGGFKDLVGPEFKDYDVEFCAIAQEDFREGIARLNNPAVIVIVYERGNAYGEQDMTTAGVVAYARERHPDATIIGVVDDDLEKAIPAEIVEAGADGYVYRWHFGSSIVLVPTLKKILHARESSEEGAVRDILAACALEAEEAAAVAAAAGRA